MSMGDASPYPPASGCATAVVYVTGGQRIKGEGGVVASDLISGVAVISEADLHSGRRR